MEDKEQRRGFLVVLDSVVVHPAYILAVLLVVQPINGALLQRGQVALGLALIAMHIPWAVRIAFRMHNAEAHGRAVASNVQQIVGKGD